MNGLITKIQSNTKIENVVNKLNLDKNINITLSGITDSFKAHMIYALTCMENKGAFVVCSNIMAANKMIQDLKYVSDLEIIYFPARKLEYYDIETESKEIQNSRMYAIDKMLSGKKNIIVTTVDLLTEKMYPSKTYQKSDICIKKGDVVNLKDITEKLLLLGYERCQLVEGKGQFSIRGDILDIFSINCELPFRIELFGDEVDNIRTFDQITQRSIDTLSEVNITFLKELRVDENRKNEIISKIQEVCQAPGVKSDLRDYLLKDIERIKNNDYDTLYDKYFELFVNEKSNIVDYLKNYNLFIDESERFMQKVNNIAYENYETLKVLSERSYIYLPFANKTLTYDDIIKSFTNTNTIYLENMSQIGKKGNGIVYDFDIKEELFYRNGIEVLLDDIKKADDKVKILTFPTEVRVEQVKNYLIDNGKKVEVINDISMVKQFSSQKVYITKGMLSGGYSSDEFKICLIAEPVSGVSYKKKSRVNKEKEIGQSLNSYDDLKIGDFVVHEAHGIGIYKGIHNCAAF